MKTTLTLACLVALLVTACSTPAPVQETAGNSLPAITVYSSPT